jgi:hypothetical protein
MRVRLAVAVLALMGAAGVAAPLASATPAAAPSGVTFALIRTAMHASFSLTMQIGQRHKGEVLFSGAIAGIRSENGKFTHLSGLGQSSAGAPGGGPRIWVDGKSRSPCISLFDCPHGLVALGVGINDSDETLYNRIYVPVRGQVSDLNFKATGWRLQRTKYAYRTVEGISSSAAEATYDPNGVEVFQSATTTGGPHGSIAVGDPPCSTATVNGVARGAGTVTLIGGPHPSSVTCPKDTAELVDYTTRKTRWTLSGTVVGDTTQRQTRLLVLDLPLP